ncbi:MAG: Mrp/NBP35 family ATP-binding protein [Candidatus Caldatribacterium sp.]|nr:Mrp/NBP35 family ATP-binding protein [Candidatus Caldatribacterium sp.]
MSRYSRIGKIFAVMSGKGGVGKSTVSALLACEFARRGKRVGIMDTDLTGPSIPTMFGVEKERPEVLNPGIFPVRTRILNIEVMSLNLLLEEPDQPVIWRGPLLSKAIQELWEETIWSDPEILVLDLPPGTGDIPLTILQTIPLTGVVIVSSPQDLALLVVRKAIHMVEELKKPIVGILENMSYIICPHCKGKIALFGKEKGSLVAAQLSLPFLGSLPQDPELARRCDEGTIEEYENEALSAIAAEILKE